MTIIVTGAAGFIGTHVCQRLLADGRPVLGIDSLNDYYDPALKQARLDTLQHQPGFSFIKGEVRALCQAADPSTAPWRDVKCIIHLAAQPGVRYSLENPHAYVDANVHAQVAIMELARRLPQRPHVVYASSSSVYGRNRKLPWSETDRTDAPASLYAATKKSGEMIAETYAHLYDLKLTGLRFFTVYGPYGRPDMAPWLFTSALFDDRPIRLFNHGKQQRDFTYVDDIVSGVIAAMARPDTPPGETTTARHRLYNLGNHQAEELEHFVSVLEQATGHKARIELEPAQPGDVVATYADIGRSRAELGFQPTTSIAEGLPRFVDWFRQYHGLAG